ncbi:MAG: tRNA pseudouridine(55) synthase TruB [Gemmatimonadales bacterium]
MTDGLLLIDKPAGPTSHDVVAAVRRALGERRVGHAGTLDPAATGLLVVLVGRATRLARFIALLAKHYVGTVRFGWETSTDDAAGEPLARDDGWRALTDAQIAAALARVAAEPLQLPPRVSAKLVNGERAYRRVRRGEEPDLSPAPVAIHALTATAYDAAAGALRIDVECGAGTYVRAIARDLGRALGTRAHLAGLRRLAVGPWRVEEAQPLDAVELHSPLALRPMAEAVAHLPALQVGPEAAAAVAHGRRIEEPARLDGPVAVFGSGELLAVAEWREGRYAPLVVLTP